MRRRDVLTGGATVVTAVFAGCTGGGDTETATTSSTTAPTTTTVDEEARADEHITAAAESLASGAADFETESSQFSGPLDEVDFQTSDIHAHVEEANQHLDDAEPLANDDQREEIQALRTLGEWLAAATDAMSAFGTALNNFETANTQFENEQFADAETSLDSTLEAFDEADSHLSVAESELEDLNTAALDDVDPVDYEELTSGMDELQAAVESMTSFARGYRGLTRGFQAYFDALAAYQEEQFEDAAGFFEDARNDFASAHTTFQDGKENAPPDLAQGFAELQCLSGALRDASDHFSTAASAAADGDFEAAEEAQAEAEQAASRCE